MIDIFEKPIMREGKLIGYWQYSRRGNSFLGYRWLTKSELKIGTRKDGVRRKKFFKKKLKRG